MKAHEGDLQDQESRRVSRRSTSGATVVAGGGSEECWLAAGLGKGMQGGGRRRTNVVHEELCGLVLKRDEKRVGAAVQSAEVDC